MGWKTMVVIAALIIGGIIYYFNNSQQAPQPDNLSGYVNGLKGDVSRARGVVSVDNVKDVQAAVERYKSDKEANPSSLQDLVPNYLDHIPGGVQYDPSTGTVTAAQ